MKFSVVSAMLILVNAACAQTNDAAVVTSPDTAVSAVSGQAKANRAVERLLKERSLKYAVCECGDFKLSFGVDGGRSQVVFISSEICEVDGFETIHIFSPAYRGTLTKPMLRELLYDSVKVGAWHVEREDSTGKDVALFVAKISADVMASDFETCLRLVAQKADDKEASWTDVDEW